MSVDLGRDINCTTSIRTGRMVTGARLVAEALFRRYTTPRGALRGGEAEKNYGRDITRLIGSVSTKDEAVALEAQLRAEALKDERVESVDVTVVETTVGPGKSFDVTIDGQTGVGPFQLKMSVSELTVALLGITAGGPA